MNVILMLSAAALHVYSPTSTVLTSELQTLVTLVGF